MSDPITPAALSDDLLGAVLAVGGSGAEREESARALVALLAAPGVTAALRWRVADALVTLAVAGPHARLVAEPEPDSVLAAVTTGLPGDAEESAEADAWQEEITAAGCSGVLLLPLGDPAAVDGLLALYAPEPAPWQGVAESRLRLLAQMVHTVLAEPGPVLAADPADDEKYRRAVAQLHADRDPETVCRRGAAELVELVDASWALVARCDAAGATFDCHLPLERFSRTADEAPLLAAAVRAREWIEGPPGDDPGDLLSHRLRMLSVARVVSLPLVFDGQVLGAMQVGLARPDQLSAPKRRRIERLSFHVGLALRDAGLLLNQEEAMARLRRAQHEATEGAKFRALAQMAGGVAHEFNNALGGILGRAQMLQRQTRDHRIQKGLRTIFEIGWRAAETVRRLQDFTRERSEEDLAPITVAALWERLVEAARDRLADTSRLSPAKYHVELDRGSLEGALQANPDELVEAVGSVLLNAFEATPGGGVVTLHAHSARDQLHVTVVDSGRGMSPEEQQSIFDPFYSTKAETGVGLGLSMTYGIISRHRGEIGIESAPGVGTTVSITLPLSNVVAEPEPEPTAERRVLVIDDEEALCEVLAELFASAGFDVEAVAGGREGIERFLAGGYDLVCTDLRTEDVSGWEVIRAVKESGRGTPVMLLTGFRDQLRQEQIDQSGVDAVLGKPFTLQQVMEAAERLLGES